MKEPKQLPEPTLTFGINMKRFATSIACLLMLSGVGRAKDLVPSDRTAIFPAEKAAELIRTVCLSSPHDVTGYWTPGETDIEGVEDTLVAYLRSQRVNEKRDWAKYCRQVAGLKRGEELLIFISYFQYDRTIEEDLKAQIVRGYDPKWWKTAPYMVYDGGGWFFRVLYDVKHKRFIWYEINGIA